MFNPLVAVVALEMGLKEALFDDLLLHDSWLICLGGLFIMVCMWIYTRSLVLTVCAFVAIVYSLGVSYFLYKIVFRMPFFPFMNLLAVIVIVGIGADDVFIYVKAWKCVLADRLRPPAERQYVPHDGLPIETLAGVIAITWKHAAVAMGVTSLTTAFAFFTSWLNSITAVKCFG